MWTQSSVGSSVILSSHRVTIEAGTTQGVSHTQAPLYRSQCPGQRAVTAVARPGWRHRPGRGGLGPVWCRHQTRAHPAREHSVISQEQTGE